MILFGVAPSLVALRFDLSSPLRSDTRSGTEGRRLRKVRQALVASQLALAVVVLAGAGLLVRSLARLASMDMGYSTEHLTMLNVSLPWRQYADDCRPSGTVLTAADTTAWSRCADRANFAAHERVMANLRTLPQVVSISPAAAPPFLGSNVWMGRFAAEEQSDVEAQDESVVRVRRRGPGLFPRTRRSIIHGPIIHRRRSRGRAACRRDHRERRASASGRINPRSASGFASRSITRSDSLITVVGVVKDFHYRLHRESTPTIFRPYRQVLAQGYFVVRTRGSR